MWVLEDSWSSQSGATGFVMVGGKVACGITGKGRRAKAAGEGFGGGSWLMHVCFDTTMDAEVEDWTSTTIRSFENRCGVSCIVGVLCRCAGEWGTLCAVRTLEQVFGKMGELCWRTCAKDSNVRA